jgi:hypothetical protein
MDNITTIVLNATLNQPSPIDLNATLNQPYPLILNATLNQASQSPWTDWLPAIAVAVLGILTWALNEWAKRCNINYSL